MLIREFLEFKNSNDSNAELIQNVVRENNNNQSKIIYELERGSQGDLGPT